MVKFHLEQTTSLGRLGKITQWGSCSLDHSTPSCMTYLRAGHIPHLTWDVAEKQLDPLQKPIYQLALPSLVDSHKIIDKFGKGVAKFCGMPSDCALHLSNFDPLGEFRSGYNDQKSVALWTKAGKISMDVKMQRDLVNTFQVDSFETLVDYDVPREISNKRLSKSVDRTISFNEQTFNNDQSFKACALISLGGGFSQYHRKKCATDVGLNEGSADTPIGGYALELHDFASGKEYTDVELNQLLTETFDPLPKDRLRYVPGCFNPTQVHHLVSQGVDLFDSSYAIKVAEEAKAIKLADDYPHGAGFDLMDFSQEKYKDDFTTLFEDCECYCCKNYTKGYLHHLNNTRELLCSILLVIHNMHEYERMFALIRKYISEKSG